MTPDDPRHGSHAGYQAHMREDREPCDDCTRANARYHRYLIYDLQRGRARTVPSIGAQRRIRALQRLGWSLRVISREAGFGGQTETFTHLLNADRILRTTHDRVAAVYDRLSMRIPTGPGTARARADAERKGHPPPLAWDDIDDPAAKPATGGSNHKRRDDVDPVVVQRILAGEPLPATVAERNAVVAAWAAAGRSLNELERMTGWRAERYRGGAA